MNNIKLLIVDDQILFAESLKIVLETRSENIKVIDLAANGKEAVKMAEIHKPDLILMDIRMPLMDGYEATTQIRLTDEEIPILAMTAVSFDHIKDKCLGIGMNDYVTKPVKESALLSLINEALAA